MTDAEKLQNLINEAEELVSRNANDAMPEFEAWHSSTLRFLTKKFGDKSLEVKQFRTRLFGPTARAVGSKYDGTRECARGLKVTISELREYLSEENESTNAVDIHVDDQLLCSMNKIFIIHGHDGELKEAVARLIEKQGIKAIILSEMTNAGKTIIEKFEENSDVGAAIALFTGDDVGGKSGDENQRLRARQNVVFECGYFMGKLGRNRVMIITEKGVELPSDLQGIVWTNVVECKLAVLQELDAMGFDIDLNVLKK